MFESIFEAINEKIERLKLDISLKDWKIEELKEELEEAKRKNEALMADIVNLTENLEACKKEFEGGERF